MTEEQHDTLYRQVVDALTFADACKGIYDAAHVRVLNNALMELAQELNDPLVMHLNAMDAVAIATRYNTAIDTFMDNRLSPVIRVVK